MQSISPLVPSDLLAKAQRLRYKFEVYDGAGWVDLCAFAGTSPLPGWPYCKLFALPIPTADLVDFPVKVPIIADADIGAECLATGYDIRFTAADGSTLLPYERESFAVAGGEATGIFWVKSDVATAGTYIWCYYGNAAAADGENAEAVWDSSFKAVYHMKDATTSTILDSTSNDNDGAKLAANEPIEATGKIAKGQDFDGTDDYVSVTDNDALDMTGEMSLSFWANLDSKTADQILLIKGTAWGGAGTNYEFTISGNYAYWDVFSGGVQKSYQIPLATLDIGTWHHFFCYYDGTYLGVFINGTSIGAPVNYGAMVLDTNANPLLIGEQANHAYNFGGLLDEVRISSIARSAEWIAYEYANMNPADGGLTWGAEENLKNLPLMTFES